MSQRQLSAQQAQQQQHRQPHKPKLPLLMMESACASSGALLLSNPFELIKTRMQLQGELQAKSEVRVVYRGMLHGIGVVARTEGVLALYQGLACSALHQVSMNGVRFGLYNPVKAELSTLVGANNNSSSNNSNTNIPVSIAAAFLVGVVGSFVGNPWFLLKTRMQAMNASNVMKAEDKVGAQYSYNRGMADAAKQIYVSNGFRGFFTGVGSCMARTGVGSAAQLPMYDFCKQRFGERLGLAENDIRLHAMCSLVAAANIVLFMNPFDVVNVRFFAGKRTAGASSSVLGALRQIVRIEGVAGLYKGSTALYWRTAPHSTGTFVLLEQIRARRGETSAVAFPSLYEWTD